MKTALIIGAILLVLGILVSLVGLYMLGFDFSKLSSVTYTTHTYTPEGDFTDIYFTGTTCDVRFAKSEDDACKVVCKVDDRFAPAVTVKDGKLSISVDDTLKWWQRIGFNWGTNTVTVYLPEKDYSLLEVNTVTGDVIIDSGISLSSVTLTAVTGDIQASSLSCQRFSVNVTTGDIMLRDVIAQTMNLKSTTGDIELDRCDGDSITIKATTGDVEGSLRSGKQFYADVTTGKVRVPSDSGEGTCTVTTTTGDIEITVA